MPTKEKDIKLEPIGLKANGDILIKSINNNGFEWQMTKTNESLIELADSLNKYAKQKMASEQVCMAIADTFIQIGILEYIFPRPFIQQCINKRLVSIANKAQRSTKKTDFKENVGFRPPNK